MSNEKKIDILSNEKIEIEYELDFEKTLKNFSKVSKKTMKGNINVDTGFSRNHIQTLIEKGKNNSELYTFLSGDKKDKVSPLSHLIENGHKIKYNAKKNSKRSKIKKIIDTGSSSKGNPFVEKTVKDTKKKFENELKKTNIKRK